MICGVSRPLVRVKADIVFPGVVKAVLFDMDGTLTRPNQIDFGEIRRQLSIPPGEWID